MQQLHLLHKNNGPYAESLLVQRAIKDFVFC